MNKASSFSISTIDFHFSPGNYMNRKLDADSTRFTLVLDPLRISLSPPPSLRPRLPRRTLAMLRGLRKPCSPLLPSPSAIVRTISSQKPGLGLGFQPSPCKDADALSHLLITHHNPYHPLESSLQLAGTLNLTPSLTLQTLIRLKNHSKIALSFFLFARDSPNPNPDPNPTADAYDLMVDIMGRVRQFDVVWQLVVERDQRGVPPTARTFGILMRRYVAAGFTRLAIRAFDDMEGFIGREAGAEEFKMLLDTLCKYGYPKV